MAIAFVQRNQDASINTDGGSPNVATFGFDSAFTNPSTAFCILRVADAATVTSVVGNVNGAYSRDAGPFSQTGNLKTEIWRFSGTSAGTETVTITVSDVASVGLHVWLGEYTDLAASPLDQTTTLAEDTSTTPLSPSVTTTQADELLLGVFTLSTWPASFTPNANWTDRSELVLGRQYVLERIVASINTYASGMTIDSMNWGATIVTYKAAGGGPAPLTVSLQDPVIGGSVF